MTNIFLLLVFTIVGCISTVLCHDRLPPGVNPTQYHQQPHHHGDPQQMHQTQYGHQPPPPPQQHQQHIQQQQHHQMPQHQVPHQQQHHQVPQQQQQHQVPQQQHQVPQQQQHQVPQQQHQVPQQQQQQQHAHAHGQQNLLDASNIANEKDHIQEHLNVPIDTSKMSEQELQFHYFKMHDADNNNKLDGCELIKSLIHWHEQGHKDPATGQITQPQEKLFKDEELVQLIDPILSMDDINGDGYIDYPEFVRAQQKAAKKSS